MANHLKVLCPKSVPGTIPAGSGAYDGVYDLFDQYISERPQHQPNNESLADGSSVGKATASQIYFKAF
jgi:hypothetical protein